MINGTPRYLVTGRTRSGSWQIRGEQLGAAIGATTVELRASKVKGHDLAILVKRPPIDLLYRLHSAKIPIVWDVVDAWPQPDGNSWGRTACMSWMRTEIDLIKPIGIVAATQKMAEDCALFGIPVLWLPHHTRPEQRKNPIRLKIQTVGYEGSDHYLGHWHDWLEEECKARGWRFLVNPGSLSDLDVVVAFRYINGYATSNWKSNVKLANAQGSGTPCVLNREAGYVETSKGGETWANDLTELRSAFNSLIPVEERRQRSAKLLESAPQITEIAKTYKSWLDQLKF